MMKMRSRACQEEKRKSKWKNEEHGGRSREGRREKEGVSIR